MSWQKEIDELRARQKLAQQMGGPDKVKRQHDNKRLTVRERIDQVLDPGSFHEIGSIAGKATYNEAGEISEFLPANFVMGRGRIENRPVVVGGDDFTVRGGAGDAAIGSKQVYAEQMANELQLPIVRLIDGTGGGGSVKTLEVDQRTYVPYMQGWKYVVDNLATVPVVGLGLGPVAGLGSARLVTSHYSLMVKENSQMFIAGPPLVARAGQTITKEELGGAEMHAKAGAVDDVVDSEQEAFARTRKFLSYLPPSVYELPPRAPCTDPVDRRDAWLIEAIPRDKRKVYDIRRIIKSVVDKDSFFEMGRKYGGSVVTGLARLDGWPVAIVASDPYFYGGGWTADSSIKVTRFLDMAETFHLPVVDLADIPGFVIGLESEKAGTIRHGSRALAAVYQAKVPWCAVMLRRAFGVAGAAHSNYTRLQYRYAWPSGNWGSLPIEGGLEAAYRAELAASDNPDKLRQEIEDRLNTFSSPFRTAEAFLVEEIIDPRETRPLLCEFANLVAPLRKTGRVATSMRP